MGMDVIGQKPTSKKGEYFYRNVWWWHPLAEYCIEIAPEIAARCKGWHYNDGDGLNGQDSAALADALEEEIRSGRCGAFAESLKAELTALPNERCPFCEGTGVRVPAPERSAGDTATGLKCNICDGSGVTRPGICAFPFKVENVQAFVNFLRGCGGFSIW